MITTRLAALGLALERMMQITSAPEALANAAATSASIVDRPLVDRGGTAGGPERGGTVRGLATPVVFATRVDLVPAGPDVVTEATVGTASR